MKTFTYDVDGTTFSDTEAFGSAWKDAKKLAAQKHCGITRTVVEVRHEFYSHGCFLNQKDYSPEKEYIFDEKDLPKD